jgi:hypothetical protein
MAKRRTNPDGAIKAAAVEDILDKNRYTTGQIHKPLRDYTKFNLEELGVYPVRTKTDPKTGFKVGGTNSTYLIRTLQGLNGRSIAALEQDMRPARPLPWAAALVVFERLLRAEGVEATEKAMAQLQSILASGCNAATGESSQAGFLGPRQRLRDVLAKDNQYVVEELGLSHQNLARHLHVMGGIAFHQLKRNRDDEEFLYQGRRFKVEVFRFRGYQFSPFGDGTKGDSDVTVHNLDNGEELTYSLLVPHMIERYGFYEGKGTPYRVEPRKVLEVLDFLKRKSKKE